MKASLDFSTCLREGLSDTPFSIRRVLAAVFTLNFIGSSIGVFCKLSYFLSVESWVILSLVLGGLLVVPVVAVLVLLFFTTWGELGMFIKNTGFETGLPTKKRE